LVPYQVAQPQLSKTNKAALTQTPHPVAQHCTNGFYLSFMREEAELGENYLKTRMMFQRVVHHGSS
jgi:hypothetical protein